MVGSTMRGASRPRRRTATPVVVATLTALAVLAVLSACSAPADAPPSAAGPKPRVTVTTPVLGDVVRNALGDQAQVEVLVPPGVDPRTHVVTADQRRRTPDSSVVVVNGLGADPELGDTLLAVRARGHEVIDAASRLNPLRGDPHVWLDADRMTQLARIVADAVAPLPTVDRAQLRRQTDAYAVQLARADEAIQTALLPLPEDRRALVTEHDELGYFAERYGLQVVATVDGGAAGAPGAVAGSPGSAPVGVDDLAARMRDAHARVILTATDPPPARVRALADAVDGVRVVTLDVTTLGPPGSATATEVDLLTTLGSQLGRALAA